MNSTYLRSVLQFNELNKISDRKKPVFCAHFLSFLQKVWSITDLHYTFQRKILYVAYLFLVDGDNKCFRLVLNLTSSFDEAKELCRAGPGLNPDLASISNQQQQSKISILC